MAVVELPVVEPTTGESVADEGYTVPSDGNAGVDELADELVLDATTGDSVAEEG